MMNTSFNVALLRNIKTPVFEALAKLESSVNNVIQGKTPSSAIEGAGDAHLVTGSLKMIGGMGGACLAESIEGVIVGLCSGTIEKEAIPSVLRDLKGAIKALTSYLNGLLDGEEDHPLLLWESWSALVQLSGKEEPHIEQLFFPVGNFEDTSFVALNPAILKEKSIALRQDFEQGVMVWSASEDDTSAARGLTKAKTAIEGFYGLYHRKGFQGYWLALRARIQQALLSNFLERQNKEKLTHIFTQATAEIRRFTEGQAKASDTAFRQTFLPLVDQRVIDSMEEHPVFKELSDRFGIEGFLVEMKKALKKEDRTKMDEYLSQWADLKILVQHIREEWDRVVLGGDDCLASWGSAVRTFLAKKESLPGPAFGFILEALEEASMIIEGGGEQKLSEEIITEMAALFMLLDVLFSKKDQVSEEFSQQCLLQRKRVSAAINARSSELKLLPVALMDQKTQDERRRHAFRVAISEIRKDVAFMEESVGVLFKATEENRADALEGLTGWEQKSPISVGALILLKQPLASRILQATSQKLSQILAASGEFSDNDQHVISVSIAGMSMFLEALEKGNRIASTFLASASALLFGEDALKIQEPQVPIVEIGGPVHPELAAVEVLEKQEVGFNQTGTVFLNADENPEKHLKKIEVHTESRSVSDIEETSIKKSGSHNAFSNMNLVNVWDESSDPDIASMFIEETQEVIQEIRDSLARLENGHDPEEVLTIRRQFHTLKGSGRLAHLKVLGEVAFIVETILSRRVEADLPLDEAHVHFVEIATDGFERWVGVLRENSRVLVDATPILEAMVHLDTNALEEEGGGSGETASDQDGDESFGFEPEKRGVTDHQMEMVKISGQELARSLFDLFAVDATDHCNQLQKQVQNWQSDSSHKSKLTVDEYFELSAHTLKSLGKSVHLTGLASLGEALEYYAESWMGPPNEGVFPGSDVEIIALAVEQMEKIIGSVVEDVQSSGATEEPPVSPHLVQSLRDRVWNGKNMRKVELAGQFSEQSMDFLIDEVVAEDAAVNIAQSHRDEEIEQIAGVDKSRGAMTDNAWDETLDALQIMSHQIQRLERIFRRLAIKE